MKLSKFSGDDLNSNQEWTGGNLWEREEYPEFSRLIIASDDEEVPLILRLCRGMNGPFGVLYVLLAARVGYTEARYQSSTPVDYNDLELFLSTFQNILNRMEDFIFGFPRFQMKGNSYLIVTM